MKDLILYLLLVFTIFFSSCDQNPQAGTDRNISATQVKKLIETNPEIIIMDVRTPEEFAQGHVAGAMNLNFYAPDFKQQLDQLDRSETYLLYCASGNRSGKTAAILAEKDFKNFYNSTAGFTGLKAEGVQTK